MTALTDNALCVCLPDNCQLECSPVSTPPHVPRAPRTRIHVARTRLLTTSTTPSRGTQPQHNAGLHAQQLAKPTRSHAQHHAATTTTTTTTKLQRERAPPARAPPVPQQRGRHQHEAPRNPSNTRQTPANEARVLKHDNSHTASKRTSAKAAQHTPPPHAGASSPCPSSSPARRADEPQQPKPPKHQLAISITTTSAAMTTTHVVVRGHSTTQRSSSFLSSSSAA
jgi:hypothetical protein